MPLKNRKEEEVSQLKGVMLPESADPSKIKFGTFQRLANMTPAGVGSMKRKRGVNALDGIESPELTISFQDNFERDDCAVINCLEIDDGSILANSGVTMTPNFCFYAGQLCFNRTVSVSLEFVADTEGDGRSGIALAIPADATPTVFSGYGLVYTPGTLTLAKWTDATLASIETTLDTFTVTLIAGDVITLLYDTDTGELAGFVNDDMELTATDNDLNDPANQGVGVIIVGSA